MLAHYTDRRARDGRGPAERSPAVRVLVAGGRLLRLRGRVGALPRERACPAPAAFCERLLAGGARRRGAGRRLRRRRLRAVLVRHRDRARARKECDASRPGPPEAFRADPPRSMTARRALLTGATGFVGGHAARALLDEGWSVRALARSDPARSPLLAGVAPRGRPRRSLGRVRSRSARPRVPGDRARGRLVKARTLDEYRAVNVRGDASASLRPPRAPLRRRDVRPHLEPGGRRARPARSARSRPPIRRARSPGTGRRSSKGRRRVRRAWPGAWIVLRPGVVYGPGDRAF